MLASFHKWAKITLVFVYLVIIAGAVVRMTNSGMGCPDWPKCFGSWIPPTSIEDLPENYQEIYSHRGYANTAFNPSHTWTEYINRLIGALSGVMVLIMAFKSLKFWRSRRVLVWLSFLTLGLMMFQAWLGAVVVYSVLEPVKITIHMLAALIIVSVLLLVIQRSKDMATLSISKKSRRALYWIIGLTFVQVFMGTQVRQTIDDIAVQYNHEHREMWIDQVDYWFYVHRSFSILLLAVTIFFFWKNRGNAQLLPHATIMLMLLVMEAISGVLMTNFSFPILLQPIHLVLASIFWGEIFYVSIRIKNP